MHLLDGPSHPRGESAAELAQGALASRRFSTRGQNFESRHPRQSVPTCWPSCGTKNGRAAEDRPVPEGNYALRKIHNSIGAALGVTLDDFGDAGYAKGRIDEMMA